MAKAQKLTKTTTAPEDHKVILVHTGNDCIAVPHHRPAKRQDTITFIPVKTDVTLFFPEPNLFEPPQNDPLMIAKGEYATLAVAAGAPTGVYPYTTHCKATNSFAIGNSDDDIIIYR